MLERKERARLDSARTTKTLLVPNTKRFLSFGSEKGRNNHKAKKAFTFSWVCVGMTTIPTNPKHLYPVRATTRVSRHRPRPNPWVCGTIKGTKQHVVAVQRASTRTCRIATNNTTRCSDPTKQRKIPRAFRLQILSRATTPILYDIIARLASPPPHQILAKNVPKLRQPDGARTCTKYPHTNSLTREETAEQNGKFPCARPRIVIPLHSGPAPPRRRGR